MASDHPTYHVLPGMQSDAAAAIERALRDDS